MRESDSGPGSLHHWSWSQDDHLQPVASCDQPWWAAAGGNNWKIGKLPPDQLWRSQPRENKKWFTIRFHADFISWLAAAPHLPPNHTNKVTPTLFLPLLTFPDHSFYCHWYLLAGALSRQRAPITSYHSVTSNQCHRHRSEYKCPGRSPSWIKTKRVKTKEKLKICRMAAPRKHAAAARRTLPVFCLPCSWILNVQRTVQYPVASVGCMSPHLCVIVFWVRAAVSLCCPLWSLGPAGNLECAPQLGRDIQLIHFLVSENGNAKLDTGHPAQGKSSQGPGCDVWWGWGGHH